MTQESFFDDEPPPTPDPPGARRYEIPPGTRHARCSSCGAAIYWVTTPRGAHMPLSAVTTQVDANGRRSALPHWVDCPNAAVHRDTRRGSPLHKKEE